MNLRTIGLISTLALGLLAASVPAEAQQPGKVYRVGYLFRGIAARDKSLLAAFQQGLQELGYLEGKNIVIEQRSSRLSEKTSKKGFMFQLSEKSVQESAMQETLQDGAGKIT